MENDIDPEAQKAKPAFQRKATAVPTRMRTFIKGLSQDLQNVHSWRNNKDETSVHTHSRGRASNSLFKFIYDNDPSAGSPTETLLRLLLPLNDQV